jgi:hypothetical protein
MVHMGYRIKTMNDRIRVENIPEKVFKNFRIRCVQANFTMREALIWFMEQAGKGAIRLPEKEEPK